MPTQNLEDYLRSQSRIFPLEDYLRSYKPMSLEDYLSGNKDYKKRKRTETILPPKEYHPNEGLGGILEQFAQGAVQEAIPFGLSKYVWEDKEPDTTAERIAKGVGQFAGFLVPITTVGKAVKYGAKLLKPAEAIAKAFPKIARGARLAEYLGRGALTLGGASAITGPMEDPSEVLRRTAEGAKLGAIFGAAGLAHWEQHKVFSWFIRQFGGRAAMMMTGDYQPGALDPENLAQTVWHEAINTFFLTHHIPLEAVLTGKMPTSMKEKIDAIDKMGLNFNASTEALSKLEFPKQAFIKPIRTKMNYKDILPMEGDIPTDVEVEHLRGKYRDGVRIDKTLPIVLKWDNDQKKYVAVGKRASLLEAVRKAEADISVNINEKPFDPELNVSIIQPKPPQKLLLDRVQQVALMLKQKIVDAGTFVKLEQTKFGAYDLKSKNFRVIPTESYSVWQNIKLQPTEILFRKTGYSQQAQKFDWMPVAKGAEVPSFKMKMKKTAPSGKVEEVEQRIYTLSNFDKWIEKTERQIEFFEDKIKIAEKTGQPVMATWTNQVDALTASLESIQGRRAQAADQIDSALLKKGVPIPNIEKFKMLVDSKFDRMRKSFYDPVPPSIRINIIEKRLKDSGSPLTVDHLLRLRGVKDDVLRYVHLYNLEQDMIKMEGVPPEARPGVFFELFAQQNPSLMQQVELDKQQAGQQKLTDDFTAKKRNQKMKAAIYESLHTQGAGSPMRQLLSLSRMRLWSNVEKMADHVTNMTGIPLFQIVTRAARHRAQKNALLAKLEDPLVKFHQIPAEDQAVIAEYMDRLYKGIDIADMKLTPLQQDYMETVHTFLENIKPYVRKYRVLQWFFQVKMKEPQPMGVRQLPDGRTTIISGPSYGPSGAAEKWTEPQIFKNQKALRPILEEAYNQWRTKSPEVFDAWLEARDNLGVISDAYLPEFILKTPEVKMKYEGEAARLELNALGQGHLTSRLKIGDSDLMAGMVDMFRSSHLNNRLHAYANQVLNLKFLQGDLDMLEAIVSIFREDMERAKPKGLGRRTPEAKGLSLLEYLQVYAHRLKGYPIKTGPIGEVLKTVQATFFRALTPRPALWLRNLPQRWVTVPTKSLVLDPKYWFKKQYKFDSMPDTVKTRFEIEGVNQIQSFENHYLMLKTSEKIRQIPVLNFIWDLAEKAGHIYALSDMYNRRYTFSKVFFKTKDLVNDYYGGKLTAAQLDMKLGVLKMEPGAQRIIREAISSKNADSVGFEVGKWQTENSQWQYERSTKSVAEMTGEGESWTNLLTWAKSLTQQNIEAGMNIKDGFEMWTKGKNPLERNRGQKLVYSGASQIAGLLLAGSVANTGLAFLSVNHKKKYSDYGLDGMAWELGGVTTDIIKGFSEAVTQVMQSVDSIPEDRNKAIANLLKFFDNTIIRQLTPFMKNVLAGMESVTGRSYISPISERVGKLMYGYTPQKTYVQRTLLEGITHFIMAQDPNKQEDVRQWVNRKTYELKWKAQEEGPMKPYFQAQYAYYQYLNDLFMRYKPMEVFKDKLQREYLKHYNSIKSMEALSGGLYQADLKKYELQRAGQLYGK